MAWGDVTTLYVYFRQVLYLLAWRDRNRWWEDDFAHAFVKADNSNDPGAFRLRCRHRGFRFAEIRIQLFLIDAQPEHHRAGANRHC